MSDLKSLGYITVSTNDIERWRHFAFGVLGFAEGKGPDASALYLRMDERAARTDRRARGFRPDAHRRLGGPRPPRTASESRPPSTVPGVPFKQLSHRRGRGPSCGGGDRLRGPGRHHASRCFTVRYSTTARWSPRSARQFVTGDQGLGSRRPAGDRPQRAVRLLHRGAGFRSRGAFRCSDAKGIRPGTGALPRHQRAAPQLGYCAGRPPARPTPGPHHGRGRHPRRRRPGTWTESMPRASSCPPPWGVIPTTRWCRSTSAHPATGTSSSAPTACAVDESLYTAEEITADSYWGHQWVGEMPAAMRL